ncbi:MAG: hypothetical protein ACI32N_00520 [Bulleidia sp.]
MTTLDRVQKIFRIVQMAVRLAMIVCTVGASICGAAALCALVWGDGGQTFTFYGRTLTMMENPGDWNRMVTVMGSCCVILIGEAVLFGSAEDYLRHEQEAGTPFTCSGSQKLRRLGIRFVYVPLISSLMISLIRLCTDNQSVKVMHDLPSVGIGLMLIFAAMIFRCGAETTQADGKTADV